MRNLPTGPSVLSNPQMSRWYLNAERYKTDGHWFKCCCMADPGHQSSPDASGEPSFRHRLADSMSGILQLKPTLYPRAKAGFRWRQHEEAAWSAPGGFAGPTFSISRWVSLDVHFFSGRAGAILMLRLQDAGELMTYIHGKLYAKVERAPYINYKNSTELVITFVMLSW